MAELSFEKARALVLKNTRVLNSELKSPLQALGQACAEKVKAKINVPDWDASALDGFAVRAADIRGAEKANPVILRVIGRITAGKRANQTLLPGTAIRIMTGAPIPEGADCVVGFEDSLEAPGAAAGHGQTVIVKAVAVGSGIRPAGEQIKKGSMVLKNGQMVGPGEVGLEASLGLTQIKVVRRPTVAIVATGEELLRPGQPLEPAKIYCGNASALAAQIRLCGGIPKILNIARDNLAALRRQMRRAMKFDLIITIGGSSMGDRDLVKGIMAEMGRVVFSQVEMNPGKTTSFGLVRCEKERGPVRVPHFALSGNPTAAMLGFEALVRPAILKMRGLDVDLETDLAQSAQEFANPGGKTRLLWVTVQAQGGVFVVSRAGIEGPGVLPSIAAANGIAIIPAGVRKVAVGEPVQVMPLDWR